MDKTIEQRAKEWVEHIAKSRPYIRVDMKIYHTSEVSGLIDIMVECYIAGAKDQKAIDIDNAKSAFNKACGWLSTYTWYNEVVEEFRKAMEK